MKQELELKLVEKYPKIFKEYGGDIRHTAMYFGCQNDDGWFELLDKCMEKLQYFCDLCSKDGREVQVIATTVKEKFGSLSFYATTEGATEIESSILFDIIDQTEHRSSHICEVTGEYGVTCSKGGWLKTLCYEEARKLGYKSCNPDTEKYWQEKDEGKWKD